MAKPKFLSLDGVRTLVTYIKEKLATKVDKEPGKSLSDNNYSDADVAKLESIESGAQENLIESIQVNGNAQAIDQKSVNIAIPLVDATLKNVGQSADAKATGDAIAEVNQSLSQTATAIRQEFDTADNQLAEEMTQALEELSDTIPTKTSELTNDSDYTTKGYVDDEISGVESAIPTKTSELTNDSDYTTKQYVDGELDTLEASIPTKVSQLQNDSSYVTTTQLTNGLATKEDALQYGTATAENVGKAMMPKTVESGKVTSWEFGEAGKVDDVQINGTSILENKVANVPIASTDKLGVVLANPIYGISVSGFNGDTYINKADLKLIKEGSNIYRPIVPYNQHESAFYGLAKAAGDTTQSSSSNAVGTYTDQAKTAIQSMLGVNEFDFSDRIAKGVDDNGDVVAGAIKEGNIASNVASGDYSHAEGQWTIASGPVSHTEGNHTTASGDYSHAEGYNTVASGTNSHAEGYGGTFTINNVSYNSEAKGMADHIEGYRTRTTSGRPGNHAEGYQTAAIGGASHAEGASTTASGNSSHAEGASTTASGPISHAEGQSTTASGPISHAEGYSTDNFSRTVNNVTYTHAGAYGKYSHSEGYNTLAVGDESHTEGQSTTASGLNSHAEGNGTKASGNSSHAEGAGTTASGNSSHAEGGGTTASGMQSHAEGGGTKASGENSHAEGQGTTASGMYSHAEGSITIANHRSQHVFGEFNIEDPSSELASNKGTYIEIVGNGTAYNTRSNARTLDWNGNEVLAGKLTVGAAPTDTMDVSTKGYVDTAVSQCMGVADIDATLSTAGKAADAKKVGDEISDIKADLTYKTDNVYGGSTSASYLVCTAGKTWHSTLGVLVNNTKRAASGQINYTPDMKQLDVPSAYRMIVYGNNAGIGNPFTQVSSTGVVTYNLASFPYKYIYIVILKQDLSEIDSDLTDVLSLSIYDHALPFALEQDIDQIETDIDNTGTAIRNVEADTGIYHINLFTDNLVNMAVSGTTGEPMGANSARCCNFELLPLVPNVPLYIDRPDTGFFKPLLYLFNDGVFTGTVITNFVNGNSYDADGIRFLFFKNPTTADISAQDVVDNFTIYQEASDSLNNRVKELEGGNDYSLIAYGDSLTTGAGATDSNHTYWGVCATQLAMKSRIGFGFGGSQSKAIAWTAGGLSAYVPPNVRTFNMKYADLESNVTIAANALNGKTVIVNGNEYTISQTETTSYSLPNEYTPSNIYLPIVNKNSRYTADIYVIWMGTNDNGMQWDLIDAMIAKLPHKKYVVMGLTRLGTDTSVEDEQKGYKQYGSHFLNTRVQIINNAFQILEETPTAEDTTAMSNGLIPPSLLVDGLHFNDSGYEVIGKLLAKHITALGYDFQTN